MLAPGQKHQQQRKKNTKQNKKRCWLKCNCTTRKPFPRAPMPEKLSSEDLMTGLNTRWISAIERVELNSRGRFLFRKCFCGARRKRLFNCPAAVFSNAPQSGRLFSFAVSPVTNRKKDEKKESTRRPGHEPNSIEEKRMACYLNVSRRFALSPRSKSTTRRLEGGNLSRPKVSSSAGRRTGSRK